MMEETKICRICLAMDVKMFDLRKQPLIKYLEQIIGADSTSMEELPPFACFECAALMEKYYNFSEKCLQTETILYEILYKDGMITKQQVQQINRDSLKVTNNTIHNISQDEVIHHNYDEEKFTEITEESDDLENDNSKVKMEETDEQVNYLDDVSEPLFLDIQQTELIKNEDVNIIEEIDEIDVNDMNLDDNDMNFDDNDMKLDDNSMDSLENIEFKEDSSIITVKSGNVKYVLKPVVRKIIINPTKLPESTKSKPKGGELKSSDTPRKAKTEKKIVKSDDPFDDIPLEEYTTAIKFTMEEQIEEFDKRRKSTHYQNSIYKCTLCYIRFPNNAALDRHVKRYHDPRPGYVECPICKYQIISKYSTRHALRHELRYKCKSCPHVSTTIDKAKLHEKWHRGVTYTCKHCGDVKKRWTSHLSHLRIKHPSEFICEICGNSFLSLRGVRQHKGRIHGKLSDKIDTDEGKDTGTYCETCNIKFTSAEAFDTHIASSIKHTQPENRWRPKRMSRVCRYCGESFKTIDDMRTHQRVAHLKESDMREIYKTYSLLKKMTWPTKCDHCSQEISNIRDYWIHLRRTHPDIEPKPKNIICEMCGEGFSNMSLLGYHQRVHLRELGFKCPTCEKSFYSNMALQMHKSKHCVKRCYPCTLCSKTFTLRGNYLKHLRLCHKGIRQHKCEICGKAFGESANLRIHVMTVHCKQPYEKRIRIKKNQDVIPKRRSTALATKNKY